MADGDELGPGALLVRRRRVEHVAVFIGQALGRHAEIVRSDGNELVLELLRRVEGGTPEHDRHARKLADVYGRPDPAGGVLGEHSGVVIRVSIRVEQRDHDIQELSDEQQRGGQTQ